MANHFHKQNVNYWVETWEFDILGQIRQIFCISLTEKMDKIIQLQINKQPFYYKE